MEGNPSRPTGWMILISTGRRKDIARSVQSLKGHADMADDGTALVEATDHQRAVRGFSRAIDIEGRTASVKSPRAPLRPVGEDAVPDRAGDTSDPFGLYEPDIAARFGLPCPRCGVKVQMTLKGLARLADGAVREGEHEVFI